MRRLSYYLPTGNPWDRREAAVGWRCSIAVTRRYATETAYRAGWHTHRHELMDAIAALPWWRRIAPAVNVLMGRV